MNIGIEGALEIFWFFILAVGPTFFPTRFFWLLYKIVDLMCNLNGEECKDALRRKYEPLGTDPNAYAKSHPLQIFLARVLGSVIFLLFIIFVVSIIRER